MIAIFNSTLRGSGIAQSHASRNRLILIAILCWTAIPSVFGIMVLINRRSHGTTNPSDSNGHSQLAGNTASQTAMRSSSCSTSNCHGSFTANPDAGEIRGDEYFVWLKDPHEKAYRTLFDPRSTAIIERLAAADADRHPLECPSGRVDRHRKSCLPCHKTNNQSMSSNQTFSHRELQVAEGVSCGSCHRGDQEWLHGHYRSKWKLRSAPEGTSATTEVQRCVSCHIGGNGADVNHDLIAAGHPPLRFEYVWFKSRLPKHWRPDRRSARLIAKGQGTDHQACDATPNATQTWLIGQLVSAIAALEVLERRAETATHATTWPELAEFNCSACHHDLKGNSWRQARGLLDLDAARTRRSRLTIPWGNWNLELIDELAHHFDSPESREFNAAFRHLREEFEAGPVPANAEIAKKSRSARIKLELWAKQAPMASGQKAAQILQAIGRSQSEGTIASWDRTASLVLGFAAPYRARNKFPEALRDAMNGVRIPEAFESPRDFGSKPNSDSANYLKELLGKLADLVSEH